MTVGDPFQAFENREKLNREKEEIRSYCANDPLLEAIFFALDLEGKPEEQWSSYEKRRMRKLISRLKANGRKTGQTNASSRELLAALMQAAANAGDRLVAIKNAKLPKRPKRNFPAELIAILRRDPKGIVSYFEWLAVEHPAIFCSLLGRALPEIIRHDDQGAIGAYHSAEDIAAALEERGLPPLQEVFELPKRIDLYNPPTIDVTPEK
jgi:hypothetical protein